MNRKDLSARLMATFLGELEEQVRVMNEELLALEAAPGERERIHTLFRVTHTLKGAARAVGVSAIERVCHALETLLADARDGKRDLGVAEFALLFDAADALGDAGGRLRRGTDLGASSLGAIEERLRGGRLGDRSPGAPLGIERPSPATAVRDGQMWVDAAKLDGLLASGTELLVAAGRPRVRAAHVESLRERAVQCAVAWRRGARGLFAALEGAGASPSDRRRFSVLGEELARLAGDAARVSDAVRADARVIGRVVDDVLDHAWRLRMRPFGEACEALPRAVRDLTVASAKQVELRVEGAEVEADRVVLDGLREALLQLVRNAVDHGIEEPPERKAAGKPPQGLIRVAATLHGDRIEVRVVDDGRGLDVAAIRVGLEQRGTPVPDDDLQVAHSLFEARLSTRAVATSVSGRGVGLDVVRAAVDRMGGRAEVRWVAGAGTTFVLDCPVSLATVHALLVSVGSQLVAIPLGSVERLVRLRSADLRLVEGRHVLPSSEGPVPVVALARLLPPLPERPAAGERVYAVLLRVGTRRLVTVVDELLETRELAVRPIRGGELASPVVRGAALLETGRIALVADPTALIAAGLAPEAGAGLSVAQPGPSAPARHRVLVVDDSITTRTLEASILEAAGYDVRTAVDGSDAWRMLQEQGCDLVVADIEMPRMDGFALCEAIRGSRRFAKLPIVLVTAMETPAHRARGLEVGADAYIGKSSFDQQNLLDTIEQLLGGDRA